MLTRSHDREQEACDIANINIAGRFSGKGDSLLGFPYSGYFPCVSLIHNFL